jgi:hypothetical protein
VPPTGQVVQLDGPAPLQVAHVASQVAQTRSAVTLQLETRY